MKCPRHPQNDAIGYCHCCGDLGCGECLTIYQGDHYCQKDFAPIGKKVGREFRPVAASLEQQKRHEKLLHKRARQRLVVHTKDHKTACGVCFALNVEDVGFYLELCAQTGEPIGKREYYRFDQLKALYYVRSFDGRHDRRQHHAEFHPQGSEVVVEFEDGEILRGSTYHIYRPEEPRFAVIPKDPDTNNISILVESSAVRKVYTPDEYDRKIQDDLDAYVRQHQETGLSREELSGDFFFRQRNYFKALAFYRSAVRPGAESASLRKKILTTQYNIGAWHIHRHEYVAALEYMTAVLDADPGNDRAHKKVLELRHAIEKLERRRHRRLIEQQAKESSK